MTHNKGEIVSAICTSVFSQLETTPAHAEKLLKMQSCYRNERRMRYSVFAACVGKMGKNCFKEGRRHGRPRVPGQYYLLSTARAL